MMRSINWHNPDASRVLRTPVSFPSGRGSHDLIIIVIDDDHPDHSPRFSSAATNLTALMSSIVWLKLDITQGEVTIGVGRKI
jgi:hypothetical protein